ncbi:MAG: hypothetical protein J4F29_25570, partial [Candidatus Latescibacteria bacterium]|nr:hypothetical protein [Candidatus Latescibacterota bacterium]
QLPHSDQLNIAALSGLFRNTTNSYKYLFFLSLLTLLKDRDFEIDDGILLRDIEIEMLVTAWYPHVFFKLSFGIQDKIPSVLGRIPNFDNDKNLLSKTGRNNLRKHLAFYGEMLDFKLMRYVPYRILRPFFVEETSLLRKKVDQKIVELAAEHFQKRRPLFRFDDTRKCIFLHPDWIAYLQQHQTIIEGWTLWHWADYMQRRNPSIPAVTRKLFPPNKRESLNAQRKFWDTVIDIDRTNIRCIYTGKKLDCGYALDHFLPWKFVVHNQLWNLIPAYPQANSSKSDRFPSEIYIDHLAATHCAALSIARDSFSNNKWKKEVGPYITDLHIDKSEDTLDFEKLRFAYRRTLEPLMSIAEQQGFHCGWTYG